MYAGNHLVSTNNSILSSHSITASYTVLKGLMQGVSMATLCCGNFEAEFIEVAHLRKGKFLSPNNELVAVLDESMCISVDGIEYSATVRHVNCSVLLEEGQSVCLVCVEYRNTLRSIVSRTRRRRIVTSQLTHANIRYLCRMRTPYRSPYIRSLQKAIKTKNMQIKRLNTKVKKLMQSKVCVEIDSSLSSDIQKVIDDHKVLEGDDFKRIFWEQQVRKFNVQ